MSWSRGSRYTVEPRYYNEVLGTMKITLLYQVSHYIRVKKQRNIKSCDQQNYLVKKEEEGFVISDLFITRFHCTEFPLYTRAGVYEKCILWQNQIIFSGLKVYIQIRERKHSDDITPCASLHSLASWFPDRILVLLAHPSRRLEWAIAVRFRASCVVRRPSSVVRKLFTFSSSSWKLMVGF